MAKATSSNVNDPNYRPAGNGCWCNCVAPDKRTDVERGRVTVSFLSHTGWQCIPYKQYVGPDARTDFRFHDRDYLFGKSDLPGEYSL